MTKLPTKVKTDQSKSNRAESFATLTPRMIRTGEKPETFTGLALA